MIRDTLFDLHRFLNVCRKEIFENWKSLLIYSFMMYGVLAITLITFLKSHYSGALYFESPEQLIRSYSFDGVATALWNFAIMGIFSASLTMEGLKTKNARQSLLMLPATSLEKFLARWLIFAAGFLLVFLVAFALADATRMAVFAVAYPEVKDFDAVSLFASLFSDTLIRADDTYAVFSSWRELFLAVGVYCVLHALFVLGSVVWQKNTFPKTFATGIALICTYAAWSHMLAELMPVPESPGLNVFSESDVVWLTILLYCMSIFFWALAYFRLKEAEVINRW